MSTDRRWGIDAVILDLDGLVLDTEPAYRAATDALLREHGAMVSDALWRTCIGRPSADVARVLVERLRLPMTVEAFVDARHARMDDALRRCAPMPGAQALLAALTKRRIPTAIATSSTPHTFALKTAHHEWLGAVRTVVTSAEVARGKPAPDIYLEAARRLGVSPARCLAFEDASSGVEAAQAAGMTVIAVPSMGVTPEALAKAAFVLPTLEGIALDPLLARD